MKITNKCGKPKPIRKIRKAGVAKNNSFSALTDARLVLAEDNQFNSAPEFGEQVDMSLHNYTEKKSIYS